MLSDEEKKAIKNIKKEFEKNHILPDIANEDLGTLLNLIEKQSKEIEELTLDLEEMTKSNNHKKENWVHKSILNSYISKNKIKEILGIEEKIDNEKLLSLLQTIVDENARLEDVEDRKVQIEYNNVFNKGVKSVEDKIKAKIEEVKDGTYDAKIVLQSLLKKE